MKKIIALLFICSLGFSDNITLNNQTSIPQKNEPTKIAIQWATSARQVTDLNNQGTKLNTKTLQNISHTGQVNLKVPSNASYFRIFAWTKGTGEPNLLTNWVEVVPNKTYNLESSHLVPAVLMHGTGC
jgi:hypothetical protein